MHHHVDKNRIRQNMDLRRTCSSGSDFTDLEIVCLANVICERFQNIKFDVKP